MHRLTARGAGALLLASVSATGVIAQVAPRPTGDLFIASEPEAFADLAEPGVQPDGTTVLRQRLARLDRDVLSVARVNAGRLGASGATPALLRLNLFDDVVLRAETNRTGPTTAGYWLSGRIEGAVPGSITLVVNGDVVVGTVRAREGLYTVRDVGDRQVVIQQVDPSTITRCSGILAPPAVPSALDRVRPITPPSSPRAAPPMPRGREDGSRIDVLGVALLSCPQDAAGRCLPEDEDRREERLAELAAQIDLAVAETNQAFADSGVDARLHLTAVRDPNYAVPRYPSKEELGIEQESLRRATDPSDGHMDEIHAWQDEVAADIVVLYPSGGGGLAWDILPSADWAFAISDRWTFAHEVGHLMGAWHDRYAVSICPGTPTCTPEEKRRSPGLNQTRPFPYAFGYVNQVSFDFRTIMAYGTQCGDWGDCPTIPRFSNPDQTWEDHPLGVPGDEPSPSITGPADARRTFNETRRLVANHRVAPCLMDETRVRLQASDGRYVVAVDNGGGEVLADGSRTSAEGRFTVVDANGGCVEHGDVVSLRTASGFYVRAVRGGGSTLDATAPRATPWARFTARRARGTGALRIGDSVTLQTQTGHYVVAHDGGGGSMRADGASPGVWARFRVTGVR